MKKVALIPILLGSTRIPDKNLILVDGYPIVLFVVDPWPYLRRIEKHLGVTMTAATARALRKQKVPRRLTTDGKDLEIYRRYN